MPYTPIQQNTGLFVPTTFILDVQELYRVEVTSPEFKELLVRLYQNLNVIATSLNNKESAFYVQEEFVNSNLFFNPNSSNPLDLRACFRTTVDIGPIGAGANVIPHGIPYTTTYSATVLGGMLTDNVGLNYYPLNYADPANSIFTFVDGTNINITNNSGVNFTSGIVVLEYLKN